MDGGPQGWGIPAPKPTWASGLFSATPGRLLALALLAALPALAWGPRGHRLAADAALAALPPDLRGWYTGAEADFREAVLEPDLRKDSDPGEDARHHIHCESYGGPAGIPFEESAAVARLGAFSLARHGRLPWTIVERYARLVAAFRAGAAEPVRTESAWLGHYVADAHVPLHTTRNSNGKETAQKGLHKRWETGLVDGGVSAPQVITLAEPEPQPRRAAWTWIAEGHAALPALLAADAEAARLLRGEDYGAPGTAPYWTRFAALQAPLVQARLAQAAARTAAMLAAAWQEAGRPRATPAGPPPGR